MRSKQVVEIVKRYLELVLVGHHTNDMTQAANTGLDGSEPLEESLRVVSGLESLVNILGQNVDFINREGLDGSGHVGFLDGAQKADDGFNVLGLCCTNQSG